jgi:predicted phosphodiesterase
VNYAILSDVHANETALRTVLTDAQDFGADRVFCLGDVLGYGPDPVSALELVHDRAHVCLLGNHDAAVCGAMPMDDFTPVAAAAVATHTSRLSSKAMAWLRTLPSVCEGPGFACAHGDFSDPAAFNYILDPEDAMPSWEARDEQLLFVGHTHQPGIYVLGASGEPHRLEPMDFVVEDGKRYIVNVGSVGYPRSGACRSFYCIYDDSTRTVYFRSLPFDLEGYRRKMNGLGLDEAPWIAARAKDRMRPKVRATAHFEKTEMAIARRIAAAAGGARPELVALSAPPPSNAQRSGLGPALVVAALVVALAGVFCTVKLVGALPDGEERRTVERVEVASVPGGESESGGVAYDLEHPVQLSGEWKAYVEAPSRQKVGIVSNLKKSATAFRIENDGEAWVRFVKKRTLFDRPERIHTAVEVLTRPLPGKKSDFAFNTRLVFFGEDGRQVGTPVLGDGKNSARRKADVPAGAVSAEFRMDCRSSGVHEIAVPHFSPDPQKDSNKTTTKKKEN